MKRFGFSLLELIMALAIAAMLSISLFNAYRVVLRTVLRIDNDCTVGRLFAMASNQMERDFSGIMFPAGLFDKDNSEEGQKEEKPQLIEADEKKREKPKDAESETNERAIKAHLFTLETENKQLKQCSIVTTNAFAVHEITKARCVRVIYRLRPQPHREKLFILERIELSDWHEPKGDGNMPRAQEIMRSLEECSMVCYAPERPEKGQEKSKPRMLELTRWNEETVRTKTDLFMPVQILISGVWRDELNNRRLTFEWRVLVPAADGIVEWVTYRDDVQAKKQETKKASAKNQPASQAPNNTSQRPQQPGLRR